MMRRDQRGSGLVLALVMITVIGLLLSGLLGLADGSMRAGSAIQDQGDRIFAADAGIERAIQEIRSNPELGRDAADGGTCPSVTLNGVNGKDVSVTCQGLTGSGSISGGPNRPRNAIMSLSQTETGIYQGSNNTLGVIGAVKSNSGIDTGSTQARLRVDGPIRARGTCSDGVVNGSTGDKICNMNAAPPGVLDPLYPPEVVAPPPTVSPPACPSSNSTWLVQMTPGTYTLSAPLETLTASCSNRVIHFTPGVYYFNFTDDPTWDISTNGVSVVAGTPLGWTTSAPSRPTIPIPGGCDRTAAGVQWIFGGTSRLSMTNGKIELCPTPHTAAQRISIYQKASNGVAEFARPTGCIAQQPYSGGACALVRAGSPGPTFVSWGTVYAPSAVVDLQVGNSSEQILGRGVISRMIRLHLPGSCDCPPGMIQVPSGGSADRQVEFLATVDGAVRIRAVVVFEDAGGDVPGQTVRVVSWSVRR